MGFPYDEASWSAVDGAMFMGSGTTMPGMYTAIAAGICVLVLIYGQASEMRKARQFD